MDGKNSFIERLLGNAEKFTAEQVAQTVQLLIEHGVKRHASDIHIEPHEQYVQVRYRIDGELQAAHKISREALTVLTAKLKTLAHLNTTSTQIPQTGHFIAAVADQSFEIKLSSMPVLGGEKIVLHVTPKIRDALSLQEIGFWGAGLQILHNALARTHGLILVSAPRHHGRPTTLAALISTLDNPMLNVVAIEESIEYRIPHASQTAINPHAGLTMYSGLQAALSQDPNVILVGNLPDKLTTELALQTAMDGHLVAAGTHSDSAVSTLLHIRAQHIPPYLLASSTRVTVAQRLIRKLCQVCHERYQLSSEQSASVARSFGVQTAGSFKKVAQLEKAAQQAGLGEDPRANSKADSITHLWKAKTEGCDACHHTGYNGRIALTEVLPMFETLQQALLSENSTTVSLQALAVKEGFIPIGLDGLTKALRGLVSVSDVLRAIDGKL